MNDEVRKALDDIRIEIDAMALTLDMDDLEDGWEFDEIDIRDLVMATPPYEMVQNLESMAMRIEEIDAKLKSLEHIPVVWPYGVS